MLLQYSGCFSNILLLYTYKCMDINKIYFGDCIDIMNDKIDDDSIDLVVTDPPYGINYQSFRTNSEIIKNDDNLLWIENFFKILNAKVKDNSHLYCFCDFEMSADFLIEIRKYWKVRNMLCIPRKIKGNGGIVYFNNSLKL